MRPTKSKAVSFSRGVTKGLPSKHRQIVNVVRAESKKASPSRPKDIQKNETNGHPMSKADQVTLKAWQATYEKRDKFVQ